MNFIDTILDFWSAAVANIIDAFHALIKFLLMPLSLLLAILEGVVYFIVKLGQIIFHIISIFVALFQFIGAIAAGLFRTISTWLTVNPSPSNIPGVTSKGFAFVMEKLQGTGLLTTVPLVALAFVWFYFALKIFGLFGGQIMVRHGGFNND